MRSICVLMLCGLATVVQAQESITGDQILAHIKYFASDELKGRDSGSAGERAAGDYIAKRCKSLGLKPAGDEGTYFQSFKIGDKLTARNVVALLEGSDERRKHEYVVIGGHYDHVGMGEFGSRAGKAGRGKIHNGADDNASGASTILEIAEAFVTEKIEIKRSVLFIWFSGEERGLLGSKHYVEHPHLPLKDAVTMINLDMVGRGKTGEFTAAGTGSGSTLEKLVKAANKPYGNKLDLMPFGLAPSDNTSFYLKRIPVVFMSTGTHEQYHKPSDDANLINKDNAERVGRLTLDIARALANADGRPKHRWAELHPPSLMRGLLSGLRMLRKQRRPSGQKRARLGVGGKLSGGATKGAELTAVSEGSPAHEAGLKTGDIVTTFDGKPIASFDDLRKAIRACKPGQSVELTVVRGEETLKLKVTLGS